MDLRAWWVHDRSRNPHPGFHRTDGVDLLADEKGGNGFLTMEDCGGLPDMKPRARRMPWASNVWMNRASWKLFNQRIRPDVITKVCPDFIFTRRVVARVVQDEVG